MQLRLPGTTLSAWVVVDDAEAEIFEPSYLNDQHGPVAKCWIASETGKTFSIHWRDTERRHASQGWSFVDGVQCERIVLPRWDQHPADTAGFTTVSTSNTTARYLKFSPVETTDDDIGFTSTQGSNIGEIKIVVSYIEVRLSDNQGPRQPREGTELLGQNQKVNERSKKAGSHRTQLGEMVQREKRSYWDILRPIAFVGTFIFNYRPRDILMAHEIIPRTIGPQKQSSSSVSSKSTGGAMPANVPEVKPKEKFVNFREGKRKSLNVKVEPDASTPRLKRQRPNISPIGEGEVIDLTELSD